MGAFLRQCVTFLNSCWLVEGTFGEYGENLKRAARGVIMGRNGRVLVGATLPDSQTCIRHRPETISKACSGSTFLWQGRITKMVWPIANHSL